MCRVTWLLLSMGVLIRNQGIIHRRLDYRVMKRI